MNEKISVIIPAFNLEKELERAIESVLTQTYSNIEVIIVNDGSKDGTAEVIDAYAAKDSRIKAIHKENGGVTSARLRGVAEATGDWIGFVDGDDYIEPDMYERLMKNALDHHADISHCGYRMVFPSRVDYYYNTGKLMQQDNISGLQDLLAGRFIEPGLVNKLFRRALFHDLTAKMDSSIRINEDLLMNYWLFKESGKSVFEDFCPYWYVARSGSATNARLNSHLLRDPLTVTKIIYADADEVLHPVILSRLTRQLISGASRNADDSPELIRPFRTVCRQELRQRLLKILQCPGISNKLKWMAIVAAIWPSGYGLVHRIYGRISGNDRKYEMW